MKKSMQAIIIISFMLCLTFGAFAADTDGTSTTASIFEEIGPTSIEFGNLVSDMNLPVEDIVAVPPQITMPVNSSLSLSSGKSSFGDIAFSASLLSLAALNVADFFSTKSALKLPGLAEGNPMMKPFVKNELLFAGVKLGITALDYLFIRKIYKKNKVMGWAVSIAANLAMGYVVSNNVRLINQARGRM